MDNLQKQRYEHKYIIREDVALALRDFVSSYLDLDAFGATQPNLSYPVHSLYLDSPDLHLYHTTINGDKNRYKLRIRFYEDRPKTPVYFEVKRRTNNTISKQRGGVKREALEQVLGGQLPLLEQMASGEPAHRAAVEQFIHHMQELNAAPKAHVAYYREAWT
ncbi:MAG TPA: VTC domain-containing protein, partial [Verrucomicrobiota bacterium]|nr:VTC domain-containing protein [Verrucomicrobiota bacterium]